MKKIKPLGNTSPQVWVIEPVHGCNRQCAYCCAEFIPEKTFMSKETWEQTFKLINQLSPMVRVDVCGVVGEPTLHPQLPEFIAAARGLAPLAQIQITTNGTSLVNGEMTYKELLLAGANIIYTDQYEPHEVYEELAKESGYPYYQYYKKTPGVSPWFYQGDALKIIMLMDSPENWPKSRHRAGLLGGWIGNLNWDRARPFGLAPLEAPLHRRCNQPFLYVNVAADGSYLLCCQDGMHLTKNLFGNVDGGTDSFMNFWYGKKLMEIRRSLRLKNRKDMPLYCAKCNITFSRCDFKHWDYENLNRWWSGIIREWVPFEEKFENLEQQN